MAAKSKKQQDRYVYVIEGKEPSLAQTQCSRLLDELIEPDQRATGLLTLDADKATITEVFDELRTLPFLAKKRVVVIKQADKFISDNRQHLEAYFENPSSTGILIMTVSSFKSRTNLAKKLPQIGELITIAQPQANRIPANLRSYAKDAYGKSLSYDGAELLLELAGEELPRLYSEIDKLAVFVDGKKDISADDVNSLVGHNKLYNVFDVIDSIIAKDTAKAIDQFRRLFHQDRSAEYTFVGAFAYHLRRMFDAKVLLNKGRNVYDISKRLRIWYNRDSFFQQLGKVTLPQIGMLIENLARVDFEIKTGQTEPKTAAEQLVMKMAMC